MAFTVTPTSGVGPYTYTVVFKNKERFSFGKYRLVYRASTNVGSCITDFSGVTPGAVAADVLLETGSYVKSSTSIPAGSCDNAQLTIIRTSDNVVVDSATAAIDNV